MDTKQIVSRFLAMNSRSDLLALRTENVFDTEAASALQGLPILIDDTPGISVMELRTKARRASTNDRLEAIVVDYIQLMRTDGDDENRVQEISTITRNLKSLARELNVVVIGLSQLSRAAGDSGVEPKLSTLRECVTGDTLVCLADGRRVPIRELVGTTPELLATHDGRIVKATSDLVWSVGIRPVFRVRLASGRKIHATAEHRLHAFGEWKTVKDLRVGDRLALARYLPEPVTTGSWPQLRLALLGQLIGDGSYLSGKPLRYTTSSVENSEIVAKAAVEEFGCTATCCMQIDGWHQEWISGNGNRWHPAGVNAWLRDLGIFGQRSYEKRVPRVVFALPNCDLAVLLRHLWATDGCIAVDEDGGSVYYATNSVGLASDVAALLLRFGIVARTTTVSDETYGLAYQVHVSGSIDQLKFLDEIGTFGPRVEPGHRLRTNLADVRANTNVDTIPREVFVQVRSLMRERGVTHRAMAAMRGTSYGGSAHFEFAPSRVVLGDYARLLENDELRDIATSDLFWDRIVAIEPVGEEEVFDLTVPGPASWLADGIVSHNSGALEQDADIVLMLWKDKEETASGAPRLIHGSVAKNRNGPVGTFNLLFAAEQARFFSKAPEDQTPV
jgi:replicative DNA helicase